MPVAEDARLNGMAYQPLRKHGRHVERVQRIAPEATYEECHDDEKAIAEFEVCCSQGRPLQRSIGHVSGELLPTAETRCQPAASVAKGCRDRTRLRDRMLRTDCESS